MATYALSGALGAGKTLVAVGRMVDYLRAGKRVATNLNIDLTRLPLPSHSIAHVVRLKDFPDIEDLTMLGRGHYVQETKRGSFTSVQASLERARGVVQLNHLSYSKEEKHNGLLVLDECNVFFNSRDWGDKRRAAVLAWLRHARKLGWDVIFIMQDLDAVDKQIRKGLIEHHGVCKRADRMSIPFVGGLLRYLGLGFLSRPPRIHLCAVKYGTNPFSPVVDRWYYRGISIQDGYDTNQVFSEFDIEGDSMGAHSILSPWHLEGRYLTPPWWKLFANWCKGGKPFKPYIVHKTKHPTVARIMRLPDPKQREEFMLRFEQCGHFRRNLPASVKQAA